MKRRSPLNSILVLILAPAAVAIVVTLVVLNIWDRQQGPRERVVMLPTESSTSQPAGPGINNTVDVEAPNTNAGDTQNVESEADSEAPSDEETAPVPIGDCENPTHVVQVGQTLGILSEEYGVSLDELTEINRQADPTFNPDFISVGQIVIIPECGIPTPTPTPTSTATAEPTLLPTATDAPAGEIDVEITRVLSPGDITREAVEIVNRGAPVDLEGWRISGGRNLQYEFPGFRLFSEGAVTVYTGVGQNSPIELYWGRTEPVWETDSTVELLDAEGEVVSEFEVQ